MTDLSAVEPNEISVKLRHGATNAKLSRNPANILSAITSLIREYADLNGIEEATYEVVGIASAMHAADRNMDAAPSSKDIVAMGLEAIVNMPMPYGTADRDANQRASIIISELDDMDLIKTQD